MPAQKVANAQGGSDARYWVGPGSGVTEVSPGLFVDDAGNQFDSDGRPLGANAPGQWDWDQGLPGAREGESFDVWSGRVGLPGGGGGGGGGGFANPYAQQMKSLMASESSADLSNTKAAIQQVLISFGLVPDGFKDPLKAVDDLTKTLAAKNTESGISTYARLLESKQDEIRNLLNRLSGRGMRRTGTRGYKLRRQQLDFDRSFQDTLQQLMKHTGSLYSGFASNERGRQMSILQALMSFAPAMAPHRSGGGGGFTSWAPTGGAFVPREGVAGGDKGGRGTGGVAPRLPFPIPGAGAGGGGVGHKFA